MKVRGSMSLESFLGWLVGNFLLHSSHFEHFCPYSGCTVADLLGFKDTVSYRILLLLINWLYYSLLLKPGQGLKCFYLYFIYFILFFQKIPMHWYSKEYKCDNKLKDLNQWPFMFKMFLVKFILKFIFLTLLKGSR